MRTILSPQIDADLRRFLEAGTEFDRRLTSAIICANLWTKPRRLAPVVAMHTRRPFVCLFPGFRVLRAVAVQRNVGAIMRFRLRKWLTFAISISALCCTVAEQAAAQSISDRVRLGRGSETGEMTEMTPLGVTLSKGLPGNQTIAVNEIKSVIFDGEPAELSQARVNAANGAY